MYVTNALDLRKREQESRCCHYAQREKMYWTACKCILAQPSSLSDLRICWFSYRTPSLGQLFVDVRLPHTVHDTTVVLLRMFYHFKLGGNYTYRLFLTFNNSTLTTQCIHGCRKILRTNSCYFLSRTNVGLRTEFIPSMQFITINTIIATMKITNTFDVLKFTVYFTPSDTPFLNSI